MRHRVRRVDHPLETEIYIPTAFRGDRVEVTQAISAAHPLATLVTSGSRD
jgi:hypothetical protein